MASISRRDFVRYAALGAAFVSSGSLVKCSSSKTLNTAPLPLRLGGPLFEDYDSPDTWVQVVKAYGYNAAYCPVGPEEPNDVVKAYEKAARESNIIIAEVGVWNNPLDPDEVKRKAEIEKCCTLLDLADRIGAKCCVNVVGRRTGMWGADLTEETFDMIVETTQKIIDDVKPTRSFYALETLPNRFPDSVDSYVRLIKAINRPGFAAHLDPVNLINNPRRYYSNSDLIKECIAKLGPYIKSCHAKDIKMEPGFPVNLQECQPGLGKLDYAVYLKEVSLLPETPPLMLEHLETADEYKAAADYIRSIAKDNGLSFA